MAVLIYINSLLCFCLFHLPQSYQNSDEMVAWHISIALTFTPTSHPTSNCFSTDMLRLPETGSLGWFSILGLAVDLGWKSEILLKIWREIVPLGSGHPHKEKPRQPTHVVLEEPADGQVFWGALWSPRASI